MDISYHYFAVKSLAVLAGFSDGDSQVIAEYSQMIDDFDYTAYWRCTNVPDYIKNDSRYDLCVFGGFFNPAQTGFLSDGLLGKTDYLNLLLHRFQRFTCTPFHFIYQKQQQIDTEDYRVEPATQNDGSIISNMLNIAKHEYLATEDGTQNRHKALMKIGMLLHTFADTVAHHMFSGFNDYVNNVKLIRVTNNITGLDETSRYNSKIIKSLADLMKWMPSITPCIGHMMLEHIPDLTHLSFEMEYSDKSGKYNYYRSNTAEFLTISKEILKYLLACNGMEEEVEKVWLKNEEILRKSFLTDISNDYDLGEEAMVKHLQTAWNVPGCTYHYSSKALKKSFELSAEPLPQNLSTEGISDELIPVKSTKASDDFYTYNVIADELLIALYGEQPRKR